MGTLGDIRTVERIGWLMLALPILPIVVLLSYALIAWYQVGHFPAYGNPDPKDMGMGPVYGCVWLFIIGLSPYLWLLSILSVIFLLIAGLQRRRLVRNLIIVLVVNALYIGFMIRDPLGLTNWIAD